MPIHVDGRNVELICDTCGKAYRFKPKSSDNEMENGSHDTTKPSLCKQCRFRAMPAQMRKNLALSRQMSAKYPSSLPKPKGMSRR